MLKVRDIMTSDVVSVSSDTTLRDAIELFATRHVSGAPVIDGSEVLGVVAASDILAFEASTPGVPTERDDVEWRTLDQPEDSYDADDDAGEGGDESASDYFSNEWPDDGAEVVDRIAELKSPEWDVLSEHTVEEVMTRKVISVAPHAPVEAAARMMKESGIHRVFVTEDRRIVGVVSAIDIAYAVADRQIGQRTYVFDRNPDTRKPIP